MHGSTGPFVGSNHSIVQTKPYWRKRSYCLFACLLRADFIGMLQHVAVVADPTMARFLPVARPTVTVKHHFHRQQ